MSVAGSAPGRGGWWRPTALLRRLLPAALRGEGVPRVDYDFARRSRAGYFRGTVPPPELAREELLRRVDELAQRGALDQGSGHVFNPTIDSWAQEWSHRIEAEHDARQSVLLQREAHARAEAERLRDLADQARRRLDEAERRLTWLLDGADPRAHPALPPSPNGRRTDDQPDLSAAAPFGGPAGHPDGGQQTSPG